MRGGSYLQAHVMCPFYKYDKDRRIICEGIVERSSLILVYESKADFTAQTSSFCCGDYTKCEIYRMLMEKYEKE